MREKLEFRGGATVLFGDILVVSLLSMITFGIYIPWGYVRLRSKILDHTYLRDQHLSFEGTGGQLFGIWLKAMLLTVITFGIYGLFVCRYIRTHEIANLVNR